MGNLSPLCVARVEAERLREFFSGCYDRWEFAGSLRRAKPFIRDIDHVLIPRLTRARRSEATLFDLGEEVVCRVGHACAALVSEGTFRWGRDGAGREARGPRLYRLEYAGRRHELWLASRENWGAILAIRTGPATLSRLVVTRMRRFGYLMVNGRLHRQSVSSDSGSRGVILDAVDCPDEATFFQAAGMDCLQPGEREAWGRVSYGLATETRAVDNPAN